MTDTFDEHVNLKNRRYCCSFEDGWRERRLFIRSNHGRFFTKSCERGVHAETLFTGGKLPMGTGCGLNVIGIKRSRPCQTAVRTGHPSAWLCDGFRRCRPGSTAHHSYLNSTLLL